MTPLGGLHHVTAITGDPQRNLDFYSGLLGLRLVKKTVNFDDPGSYHLYYGDRVGSPGTLLTFFAWPGAHSGQTGSGEAVALALRIPTGSAAWWAQRLTAASIATTGNRLFGADVVSFSDADGMRVELVESKADPHTQYWEGSGIEKEHAIQAIHSVTLALRDPEVSAALYTDQLGFKPRGSEGDRQRFELGDAPSQGIIDVQSVSQAAPGRMGAGTIHHIAFRTDTNASQSAWLKKLTQLGLHVSPVMDRKYFHSIYFRELGGVLFEIATDGPGMTVDETVDQLGLGLALPSEYEAFRDRIEPALPPLHSPQFATGALSK